MRPRDPHCRYKRKDQYRPHRRVAFARTRLTTGLFTSPSLKSITERVQIDGEPISEARFAAAYEDIAPFLALLDEQAELVNGPPVTMFEAVTALAFACFADARST